MRNLHPNAVMTTDTEDLTEILSEGPFKYFPTKGEVDALYWIGRRYSVSSYLLSVLIDDSWGVDTAYHMEIDPLDVRDALADEGLTFVPCLAPDTALYKLTVAASKVKKVRPPTPFKGTQAERLVEVLAPMGLTILRSGDRNFFIRGNTPETSQQFGERHRFPGRDKLEAAIPGWVARYRVMFP